MFGGKQFLVHLFEQSGHGRVAGAGDTTGGLHLLPSANPTLLQMGPPPTASSIAARSRTWRTFCP